MSEEQWGKKFSAILQKYVDVQNFFAKKEFSWKWQAHSFTYPIDDNAWRGEIDKFEIVLKSRIIP